MDIDGSDRADDLLHSLENVDIYVAGHFTVIGACRNIVSTKGRIIPIVHQVSAELMDSDADETVRIGGTGLHHTSDATGTISAVHTGELLHDAVAVEAADVLKSKGGDLRSLGIRLAVDLEDSHLHLILPYLMRSLEGDGQHRLLRKSGGNAHLDVAFLLGSTVNADTIVDVGDVHCTIGDDGKVERVHDVLTGGTGSRLENGTVVGECGTGNLYLEDKSAVRRGVILELRTRLEEESPFRLHAVVVDNGVLGRSGGAGGGVNYGYHDIVVQCYGNGQFDIGIRQVGHPADIHVFGAEKCGHVGSVDIDLGIGNHGSLADRNADGVEYAALEHVVSRHFETNFAFTGLANSDEFDMVVAGEGIGKTVSPGDVAGDGALRCRGKRHKECGKKSKDSVHKFLLIYKYRCIILLFVPFESRMPQAFPAE